MLTIDVSSNNGLIDWATARAAGVKNAIVRATMGVAGIDTRLQHNALESRARGVKTGFYHLFRPEHAGNLQALHFINTIKPYTQEYLLAVDVERVSYPPGEEQTFPPDLVAERLRDFVETFQRETGKYPVLYTADWYWTPSVGHQHDAYFAEHCPLWVAAYTDELPVVPAPWEEWALWQYSSKHPAPWCVLGRVDVNRERGETYVSTTLKLILPVLQSAVLVQRNLFGAHPERYKDFDLSGHDGLDYAGKLDDPIYAAHDGVINLMAQDTKDPVKNPYGNHFRITSQVGAETYEMIYAHLNRFVSGLKQGDSVEAGQQIGFMGSTGNSDVVHLHFALKWSGATSRGYRQKLADGRTLVFEKDLIDPLPYFE